MPTFNILVATHPRSGTHLGIDSLCLNLRNVYFGLVRGQYPSLERLVLDHDRTYTKEWEAYVFGKPATTKIFKTHFMPDEIRKMMEGEVFSREDLRIVSHIMDSSRVIYVYRDGRDTLVSWYHYMLKKGGGLPTDLPSRIQACSFPEFMRMPNRYIPVFREIKPIDKNRAVYWSSHVESWLNQRPCHVSFEELRKFPSETIHKIARKLGLSEQVLPTIEPPRLITEDDGRSLPARLLQHWRRIRTKQHHKRRGVDCYPPAPPFARSGGSDNWTNYFTEEDLAFFNRHAGQTMQRLGYTDNPAMT